MKKIKIFIFSILFSFCSFISAETIYVDNQLPANCVGDYSTANRTCTGSDGDAYNTLAGAASSATAGTTVLIREGVFTNQLAPQNSGMEGSYITFKNYATETVEITGSTLSPAIRIYEKSYIAIEGLQVRNVRRWLHVLGSDYIIVKDNVFELALDVGGSSKTGIFLQRSHYAKILNNIMHDTTQDNLYIQEGDYNLVEGNTITKGLHALWTFKCSNNNVLRGNYFHNELQKIGEIYDCFDTGFGSVEYPKVNSLDDSKYNVVENNVFAFTPSSDDSSPYSGIQYAGQYGIIRNNVFYQHTGPPLSLSLYSQEAQFNYGNRIYHNVFYDNKFGAIDISGSNAAGFFDQKIKNNILYKNQFIQNDFRWNWYDELNTQPVQFLTGRLNEVFFDNNNLFSSAIDELYTIAYGVRTSNSNDAPETISWWETNRPNFIQNTLQIDPMFQSAPQFNFLLQANSPMIDAGAFLANTSNTGTNSTVMQVDDAKWFSNGFGIVNGDSIQLQGQSQTATILSIDYASNELALSTPLTWDMNQGVSLAFNGLKPDLGAFEFAIDLIFADGFE